MSNGARANARTNVTLSDVAAVAGVSLSTASKALAGSTRISLETRTRVAEAAERLDFRPNALAQAFASGRSRTIGLFTHHASRTFSQPVVIGALRELGRHEHASLLYDAGDVAGEWTQDHIRGLQARRVDGVLVIGDGHDHVTRSLTREFKAPVCYAYTQSDQVADRVWLPDNKLVGRLAAEHLLSLGRRRFAHLSAARTSIAVELREAGWLETLAEADVRPVVPTLIGDWTEEWGIEAVEQLLASGVEFDALFCGNDKMALGALRALRTAGVSVPDDVAVVGVDNWESVVLNEPVRHLTSIDLRLQVVGAAATRSLIGKPDLPEVQVRLDGGRRLVEPMLYVRATTSGVVDRSPELVSFDPALGPSEPG